MSALRPKVFRVQVVILVVLGLCVGAATVVAAARPESEWVTVHADKHLDSRVSLDESLWVYLVDRGDRTIALSYFGPWSREPVDYCPSSELFETIRSGSKFDLYGRYFAGPAPRGMSRFVVRTKDGDVQIQAGDVIPGPRRGRPVRFPVGPYCIPT